MESAQKVAREAEAAAAAMATTEGGRIGYEDSMRLLGMYINRGNCAWASQQEWTAPTLLDRCGVGCVGGVRRCGACLHPVCWQVWKGGTKRAV